MSTRLEPEPSLPSPCSPVSASSALRRCICPRAHRRTGDGACVKVHSGCALQGAPDQRLRVLLVQRQDRQPPASSLSAVCRVSCAHAGQRTYAYVYLKYFVQDMIAGPCGSVAEDPTQQHNEIPCSIIVAINQDSFDTRQRKSWQRRRIQRRRIQRKG